MRLSISQVFLLFLIRILIQNNVVCQCPTINSKQSYWFYNRCLWISPNAQDEWGMGCNDFGENATHVIMKSQAELDAFGAFFTDNGIERAGAYFLGLKLTDDGSFTNKAHYYWQDGTEVVWEKWISGDPRRITGPVEYHTAVITDMDDWESAKTISTRYINCQFYIDLCSTETRCVNGDCESRALDPFFSCTCNNPTDTSQNCTEASVDGGWTDWTDWFVCDSNCTEVNAIRYKYRSCTNPPPAGGADCSGDSILHDDTDYCSTETPCVNGHCESTALDPFFSCTCNNPTDTSLNCTEASVDGGWTDWTDWFVCDSNCTEVNAIRYKYRSCTNPTPVGGANCSGDFILQDDTECPTINSKQSYWFYNRCLWISPNTQDRWGMGCDDFGENATNVIMKSQAELDAFVAFFTDNGIERASEYFLGLKLKDGGDPENKDDYYWQDGIKVVWEIWRSGYPRDIAAVDEKHTAVITDEDDWESARTTSTQYINCQFYIVDGGWTDWTDWFVCDSNCTEVNAIRYKYRSCTNPTPVGGANCSGDFIFQDDTDYCSMETPCVNGDCESRALDPFYICTCNNPTDTSPNCTEASECPTINSKESNWFYDRCLWISPDEQGEWGMGCDDFGENATHVIMKSQAELEAFGDFFHDNAIERNDPYFLGLELKDGGGFWNKDDYNWQDGTQVVWENWSSGDPKYVLGDQDRYTAVITSMDDWETESTTSTRYINCQFYIVDGGWTDWTDWFVCDSNCTEVNAIRYKYRSCTNPTPFGGATCSGDSILQDDTDYCSTDTPCVNGDCESRALDPFYICTCNNPTDTSQNCTEASVNGGWTDWTDWFVCDSNCTEANAIRYKYRSCTNPTPVGGANCSGDSILQDDTDYCSTETACVNGDCESRALDPFYICTCNNPTDTSQNCTEASATTQNFSESSSTPNPNVTEPDASTPYVDNTTGNATTHNFSESSSTPNPNVTEPDASTTHVDDTTTHDRRENGSTPIPNVDALVEEVFNSLNLSANASTSEVVFAMDAVLETNGTVDGNLLTSFGSALASHTDETTDPNEMVSVMDTAEDILDKADPADAKKVSESIFVILRNAVNTVTGDPVNGTVNATGSANIINSVKYLADKIAGSVSKVLSDGDPPVKLKSDNMEMLVAKKDVSGPDPLTMKLNLCAIVVAANQTTTGAQALQALVFSENIYTFAGNANETSVDTSPLQFKVVGDLTASIEYTAESAVNKSIAVDSFDMSNVTAEEGVLTQYLIEDLYSFMKISLVIPRDSLAYIVRCHFKEEPNDEKKTIEIYIDQSFNVALDLFNTSIGFNDTTGELYIFISAFYVNDTGLFYVRMTEDIAVNSGGTTGRRRRATSSSSYSSSAAVYAPRVWNETTGTWEPNTGVAIDPGSTNEQVVFKSNYMGSITSGLISAPNTIDFDNVFDDLASKVADNPAVLIVVVLLAGLYLIFLIPIRMLDVRDYKQWEFLPILHNKPEDKFIYQISISLGAKSSASFDIPVFCVIYGSKGKTTPKTLDDGQRQLFRPSSSTNLIVTCSEDIGDITHFHIWAVTRDERDSLYIEWISVTDSSIATTYTFQCHDWLSSVNTLCYGHEIYMVDIAEGQDFKSLFKNNAKSKLFDDHLWLSVAKRPQKSNFSRVQRLSLCLSTLFLTMVINAMWFPTDPNVVDESPSIQIGPLSLSFETFSVSIIGALIVIPPNTFIMIFFRRSRPFIPSSRRSRVRHANSIYEPLKIQDLDVTGDAMKKKKINLMESSAENNSITRSEAKRMPPPYQANQATDSHNLKRQKTIIEKLAEAKNIQVQDQKSMSKCWTGNREPQTKWEMEQELKRLKKANNKSFTLPWFFIIFGYILVGVCIFNGAFWCFLYSIQWGKEIANRWLTSLCLSLFLSVLVIQPIKVILMAVLFSFFLEDSKSSPDDPSLLSTVSQHHGVKIPKETNEPPIIPQKISTEDPVVTYSEQKLHKNLMKKIKATIIHILYLVLLVLIVSHNSDTNFYRQNTAVKDTFGFADISLSRLEEIYPMLREDVFPLIYPRLYYNGQPMDAYNLQFVANMDGYLMGPVRIKQNRDEDLVCNETLKVVYSARSQIYECKPVEESKNWNSRWNGTFVQGNFEDPAYHYNNLEGTKKQGDVGSYERSGYAVDMQKYNYELILDHLEKGVWIDKQTRAVSVEFVINNMNVNIWTQIKILFELPVYGGVFTTAQVKSFRPYPYNDVWDFVFLCIQWIWALVVFYLVITETISLVKMGCSKYLSDTWHIIEILNACLCLISMGLFVFRALEVIEAVEFMKNNPSSYTDFDPVMRLDEGYSLLLAFILFIAILQLFKPMDFSKDLTTIKVALSSTSHIIIIYTTIFTILLTCYGHTLTIAFGAEFDVFSNFFASFYYLFGMLLGVVKYSDIIEKDTSVLRVMFAFYMIMGNLVILNLFISVLCDGMAVVKETPPEQHFDVETSAYIEKKLMRWWKMLMGAEKSESKFVKVRRGGPWNRELELYYSLLEEDQVTPIEEAQAVGYQESLEGKSDKTIEKLPLIEDRISDAEHKSIAVCSTHNRNEHTARLAIKTIIMDLILSDARMRNFMNPKAKPKPSKVESPSPLPNFQPGTPTLAPELEPEREQDEYHCLNETSGKVGPEGAKIEVLPGTWIVINKKTFTVPSKVRVQAYTTELFESYVIELESSEPLHKAFKVSLPFKDGKRRDYCNVFVQRDETPWTLAYNSVTCFSENLRCLCNVSKGNRRFRIAAKSTARKRGITRAGLKLETDLLTGSVVKQLYKENKPAMTEAITQSIADKWMEDAEISQRTASDHDERDRGFLDDRYLDGLDLI